MKINLIQAAMLGGISTFMFACANSTVKGTSTNDSTTKENSSPAVVDKEKIKEEIQAKEDEFAATYNSGVLKNIGYYADDAVSFYQNRPPLVGKPAIIEFLKSDLSTNTNTIMFTTNEVFVSADGGQVVEVGNFRVLDSSKTTVNTGNYMSLFEKRNGKYVSVRDMSASVMSPQ
jgi:ketosteroid isomerase-like protein